MPRGDPRTFSIASLAFGAVGLLFGGALVLPGILGLAFGMAALKRGEGAGLAIAGIALGSLQLLLMAVFLAVVI
jgi:hypothetical protein